MKHLFNGIFFVGFSLWVSLKAPPFAVCKSNPGAPLWSWPQAKEFVCRGRLSFFHGSVLSSCALWCLLLHIGTSLHPIPSQCYHNAPMKTSLFSFFILWFVVYFMASCSRIR